MPGSKRNKSMKSASSTPTSTLPAPSFLPDDELMDDLFAELDTRDKHSQAQQESAEELQDTHSSKTEEERTESRTKKQGSKVRHLARQARKAAALAQSFAPSNPDADVRVDREIKQEAASIKRTCDELALQIHEINPDGHCLFSAIADQLVLLNILPASEANYATLRAAASGYMLQNPDDFLPFLPSISGDDNVGTTEHTGLMNARQFEQYCSTIKDTAAWGGELEILALSRVYKVPVQVIQASTPTVVTHTPDGHLSDHDNFSRDARIARISFHRRMYGLGEHYNSLRPRNALAAVADKIHLMLS